MVKKIIFAIIIVLLVGFCGYEIYNINTKDNVEPLIEKVNDSVVESDSSNLMWIDAVDENDSLLDENETVVEENDTIVEIPSAE